MRKKLRGNNAERNQNAIKNKLAKKCLLTGLFTSLFLCINIASAEQSGICIFKATTEFADEYEKVTLKKDAYGDKCQDAGEGNVICTFSWTFTNSNKLKTSLVDISNYKAPIADAPFIYGHELSSNYSIKVPYGVGNKEGTLTYKKDKNTICIPMNCKIDNESFKLNDYEKKELQQKLITDSCTIM